MERKYNVFEKQTDIEVRNAQIVYMYHILNMKPHEIKNYVDLALGTIRTYVRKFADLLDKAKKWFCTNIFKGEIKVQPCAYIVEFFDKNNIRLFLKVGKSNNLKRRIKEHLNKYGAFRAEIKEVFYTKTNNYALMVESMLREHYQNIKNCGYIEQDRFTNAIYSHLDLEQNENLQTILKMSV